ncbi:MAG: hypothetical protein A4E55_00271 [Pelotomaculum sp. PtaU1.Bin035]|nr:MAG: hypothetical protein A4E55_00271 [Pelotomaculum sp. PtaU1.Bin035]
MDILSGTLVTVVLTAGIGYLTIQGFRKAVKGSSSCCGSGPGGCSCSGSPGACRELNNPDIKKSIHYEGRASKTAL